MHFLLLLWIGVGNPVIDPTTEATKPYLSNSRPAIPVAIITYSTINGGNTIADGETVVFDGTSSYDPDGGSITKYRWRINGSLQGTAWTFSWTFDIADGSSQSVKLSIWDDENEYREVTETVSVIAGGNQDPVASFTPAGSTVDDDDTVNFTSTSTDSDGTISTTEWFFNALGGTADGTGTTFNWTFDIASGSSQTIYLVVTDNESAKDTTSEVFTVQEAGTQTITRHYYLKDHLGSTRATVDDSGEVVHYADYYPFGMQLPGRSLVSSSDEPKELYTGHEHDDETGLYYAGARYYDPMIARWGSVDPLGASYPALSAYNYVANSPVAFIDPNGLYIQYVDANGNTVLEAEDGDDFDSFRRQFGLSKADATTFFEENGLAQYLPSIQETFFGLIRRSVGPSLDAGTSVILSGDPLKLAFGEATEKQKLAQLILAFDLAFTNGSAFIDLPDYFSELSAQGTSYSRFSGSINVDGTSVYLNVTDFPLKFWNENIYIHPTNKQVTVGGKYKENYLFYSLPEERLIEGALREALLIQLAPEHAKLFERRILRYSN